jgi:hypothetical protein
VPPLQTIVSGNATGAATVSLEPQFVSKSGPTVADVSEHVVKIDVPLTCISMEALLASDPE